MAELSRAHRLPSRPSRLNQRWPAGQARQEGEISLDDEGELRRGVWEIASGRGKLPPFGSGCGSAGRGGFSGSGTNAEIDRSSGNGQYNVAAGKTRWIFR
jgi:hypothetical protein